MIRCVSVMLVAAMGFSATVEAAVDCSRPRSDAEKILCSNPRLAGLEGRMAMAFRAAIHRGADPKTMTDGQRVWIHDVRDHCNDADCLIDAYETRISDLENR